MLTPPHSGESWPCFLTFLKPSLWDFFMARFSNSCRSCAEGLYILWTYLLSLSPGSACRNWEHPSAAGWQHVRSSSACQWAAWVLCRFVLSILGDPGVFVNPWSSRLTSISRALAVRRGLAFSAEDSTVNEAPAPQPRPGPRRDVLCSEKDPSLLLRFPFW